ncbi:MAG: hypothetical protein KME04_03985 [Pleurocapsa minor GSE-CHR-MK-17-07R]|jgi:hypothetical protein|nr:hypothetical protein [Pleurocapsa minor GSE-CHR-MK 17-07R]
MLMSAVAGCATAPAETTVEPTIALMPPTVTPLPTRVPPTSTPETQFDAQALNTRQAVPTQDATPSSLAESDPVAASLVSAAQRSLSGLLNITQRRVQLVEVRQVTWPDGSLGCPQPDVAYTQALVNGYRIVLRAGDTEYIYHTDFDRVYPCAEDAEVLPADFFGTPEATAEATPEMTAEATEPA